MKIKTVEVNEKNYEKIYVISDIHGHYNEFLAMLDKIKFTKQDLLIVLGDCVDRGYDNLKTLKHCLNEDNIILLMGNHEQMMTSMITSEIDTFSNWVSYNGGNETYKEIDILRKENINDYKQLMAKVYNLPHYIELDLNDKKYLLVHAGIRAIGLSDKIRELMLVQGSGILWVRSEFLKNKKNTPFTIIFGHTPTYTINYEINNNYPYYFLRKTYDKDKVAEEARESKIWKDKNKIGIDCGLFSGGKLACLRLNDMKEFYIDKIE